MKKYLFALFLLACSEPEELQNCSINTEICEKTFKNHKIIFEIKNRPIRFMQENKLIIKGLPKYDKLSFDLYGLNMDMGVIKADFTRLSNGDYESDFVLSTCLVSTMKYRLELLNNNKKIGLFIDFDMKR